MAAIPVPGVNTPTYQSWGAAVAEQINRTGATRHTCQASLPAGAGTVLSWSGLTFDSGGFISSGTEIVIPAGMDGVYMVNGFVRTTGSNVNSYLFAQIAGLRIDSPPATTSRHAVTFQHPLAAGQKVSFTFWGGTPGAALPVVESFCNVYRITPS